MSRWEMWLEQQRKLVDGESTAATFILEGTDGSRWGTWPIRFPDIEQSIGGTLSSFASELPKGKHGCKLLALDSTGQQLSFFPVTIVGGSEAATEGAQHVLVQRRADALQISNFEHQFDGLRKALEVTTGLLVQESEAFGKLLARYKEIEEVSLHQRLDFEKEAGKQHRLNELTKAVTPLFEIGMGMLAERFGSMFEEKKEAAKQAENKPTTPELPPPILPTPPTSGLPALEASTTLGTEAQKPLESADVRTAIGDEPTKSCSSRPDSSTRKLRIDGQGRNSRDGRSASGGSRNPNPKADGPAKRK